VSAEKLLDDKKEFNENTHLLRHGTDWRHFRTALDAELAIPADVAELPRPIIGFHGLLADWIDYDLLAKIAGRFSQGSVVLIGKITADAEAAAKNLGEMANVHFLGRKPYAELPAYCKAFDVALNPFAINDLTLAANPLKVREYLAAGLPVVSTDIPEVRILDDCLIGRDHADFITKVETVLESPRNREAVSDAIAHESWDAKIDELRDIMAMSKSKE